jgi:integrase
MGRRKKGTPPEYLHHKGSGQAYVTIGGRPVYLGKHRTPESYREYRRVVREWEKEHAAAPSVPHPHPIRSPSVAELCEAWLDGEARRRYALPDGTLTSEHEGYVSDLATVVGRHGSLPAEDFGRDEARDLRDHWASLGVTRGTVNKRLGRIKRLFRWACGEGLVGGDTLASVLAVRGLREGEAPDREPVLGVPPEHFEAVLPELVPALANAARFQRLIGCRPGEATALRRRELAEGGAVRLGGRTLPVPEGLWAFSPERHKTRKKRRHLVYLVGPRAQELLRPLLPDDPDAPVFPSKGGRCYGESRYCTAVRQACDRLAIPRWAPGRLRHSAASAYDAEFGIVTASKVLGHTRLETTAIYLDASLRDAAEAVRKLG